MIYILVGNDNKKKNAHIRTLDKEGDITSLSDGEVSREVLENYAQGVSMFGKPLIIVTENTISNEEINLTKEDLSRLKDSLNIFIFKEDKLLAAEQTKLKKFAEIIRFETKEKAKPKPDTFAIANAFGRHDKVNTWVLYRQAIESGVSPEAISGILFWKVKTMLLNGITGSKGSTIDDLKKQSGELVSLYHRAHRGECDLSIGLEQFILSALS
ncbi:MAG: hypothetical protein KGI58_00335 [Patescibacteria group bacterium]|nr:hypothetical protein [Patescibacteria group bacterium]